ncbi:MAG: hypothetical protein ACT4N8_02795 [Sphingosinicella sp.]|uniref:hypothetical protein n=1 Tax=Sphingosinicella sp. TaxID=1917971 RepID=UPI0040377531
MRDKDTKGAGTVRDRAAEALDAARDRTRTAYETARTRTRDTARQVTDQMAIYPVGAVIGGLAVGAILGFLLPRTKRETELLGATGRRMVEAGREAVQKGFDAGRERVDSVTGKVVREVGTAVREAVGAKD